MAIPPPPTPPLAGKPWTRFIGRTRYLVLLAMLAVLGLCLVFSWTTRDAMQHLPFLNGRSTAGRLSLGQKTLVDLRPWQTASALAPLAVSNEESELAQEAQRLADHEVDQAFASALRLATMQAQKRVLEGQALEVSKRVDNLEDVVKQDKADVADLTPPPGSNDTSNSDELEIAKAQLGLDSDQLDDAQGDLARASGDNRAQIQSELQDHEAAMKKYDSESHTPKAGAVQTAANYRTLATLIGAWRRQSTRQQLIDQARQQAQDDITSLTAEHNALEAQANGNAASANNANLGHAEKLALIREQSAERQLLSIYDNRIQTEKQLATVYERWSNQVSLQHRIVLHLILTTLAQIAVIIIIVLVCDALVVRLMGRPAIDRRRMMTLRTIFQLGLQIIGVVVVALVVFGSPRQMPTIIGLATAGLTVVLQDFIIAFFGWFVLMGKHGIRIGDWVEINGVGGEVTEIGLFRTTLLETGNWTDRGHPTGRRVTFINSFAIRGQYFNFSTTGQWMWDELSVSVPAGEDTYAMVESIHKAVMEETEKNAQIAAQEWKRGSRSDGLSQFSADATVNLRPSASGVDVLVRYVTRASDRADMRNKLFQRVLDVLRTPSAESAAISSAS